MLTVRVRTDCVPWITRKLYNEHSPSRESDGKGHRNEI